MALTKKQEEEKAAAKRLQRSKNYYANMKDQERARRRETEDKTKPGPRMSQNQARKMEAEKNKSGLPAGSPIKGENNKDLARLEAIKKQQKINEKNAAAKKATSAKNMFSSPKIGFNPKAFSIKGAAGPAGKRLKRLSSGGEVKASKYYSGGGKIFTGR